MASFDLDQRRQWSEAIPLADLVFRGAALWPDADAVVFPGERVSFGELAERTVERARSLRNLGVGPGDKVGVLMANSIAYVEVTLAVASLGAVAVLLNSRYRGSELRYVVEDADLSVLITSDIVAEHVDHRERLREALPELGDASPSEPVSVEAAPRLRFVVVLGQMDSTAGFLGESEFRQGASAVEEAEVDRLRREVAIRDVCMMMYTSGTTAQPKGCPMTHEMVVRNSISAALHRFELQPDSRFWDPLPMFHMSAILPLIGTLYCGSAYLGMVHFEPTEALRMLSEERATHAFPTFPPVTQALVNHPDYPNTDLSRLRLLNNVAPPSTLRKLQEQWVPAVQITAYGCTEIGGVACFSEPGDDLELRVTTSGRPFPGIQMRVVDPETNVEVPRGERGEICARGYSLFEGYYNDADKTAETIDEDGWFHTGDIGSMDADGRVSYLGRTKDMLKVGGENVAAAEIEALLMEHPAVAIAQVVGLPDERLVEAPAAFVELKPGESLEPQELGAWTEGRIASFKRPRHVRIVTEWPMSATKIQKFRLRQQLAAELGVPLEDD